MAAPRPHTPVLLNGIPFHALVDTGAVCTAISAVGLAKIPHPLDGPYPPDNLVGAGTDPLQTLGKYYIDVTLQASEHLNQERRFVGWPVTTIQTLETEVILGTDILQEAGATIDMSSKEVTFTRPVATLSTNPHTLPPNTYSSATTQRYSLQPTTTTMVSLKLLTPPGLAIRQGATVASYCTKESPITNLDGLHTTRSDGTVRALWYNTSPIKTGLEVGDSLPGLFFNIVNQNDVAPAINALDNTQPLSILTEVQEPLCPDKKPKPSTLTPQKRKYLAKHTDLSSVDPQFARLYKDFVLSNHDVFSGAKLDVGLARRYRHRIDTNTNTPQFRMQFKISPAHQQFLATSVKELLDANAVAPCRSGYNAPVFAVPKQSGAGLRLVQDLRQLNEVTLDDRYSVLDTRQCLNKVGHSNPTVFSSLDLSASFWQLGLAETSQHKTAFTLPFQSKQYKWLVTPMGVAGACASFSRLMGEILGHIPSTVCYVDDCLVSTPCHRSHITALEAVAAQLRRYNLKLNPDKCRLGQREVTFLGHKVSSKGISPAADKVAAIKAINPPTSLEKLYQTIGLFNFFRGLIPNFARQMAPLHRLTRKDSPWRSGPLPQDALSAFLTVRTALGSGPILRYPDFSRPFALFVDAAGGATLSQIDKGGIGALLAQPPSPSSQEFSPVSYFSRALKGSEKRYSAFDLELLALTEALRHFQEYIAGQKTVVYTDHRPLSDASKASNSKTSQRLTQLLVNYDVTIKYRKGRDNGAADALSRNPLPKAMAIIDPVFFPNPPKSSTDLPRKQQEDSFIQMIIASKLHNKTPTKHPQAQLAHKVAQKAFIADNLWWISITSNPLLMADAKPRLLAPSSMTKQIISVAHNSPLAGHWAKDRTLRRILDGWWWPTIDDDVTHFIQACGACQHAKTSETQNAHVLTPWPPALRFNHRVHVDLVGPLLSSTGNGRYIMSAVDAFSRWTMLTVLPCKTAKATRDAFFKQWICTWSAPITIVTDNGGEFNNSEWKQMAAGAGSKLHFITPYHPAANGLVERFNQELKQYMLAMVSADTRDWEEFVPTLMLAKNCSYNRHIKTTPFQVVLSSLPNAPWSAPEITTDIVPTNPTLQQIMRGRKNVWEHDKEQREAAKRIYDRKNTKATTYNIGQQVLVHHSTIPQGANKKFFRPWWGPATIVAPLGHGTYSVQEPHRPDGTLSKLHRNRLKPFYQPAYPTVTNTQPTTRDHTTTDRPIITRHQLTYTPQHPQATPKTVHAPVAQEFPPSDDGDGSFHGFPSPDGNDHENTIDDTFQSPNSSAERTDQPSDHGRTQAPPQTQAQAVRDDLQNAQAQSSASAILGDIISSGVKRAVNQFKTPEENTPSRQNPKRLVRKDGHFRKSDHSFIHH